MSNSSKSGAALAAEFQVGTPARALLLRLRGGRRVDVRVYSRDHRRVLRRVVRGDARAVEHHLDAVRLEMRGGAYP